MIRLQPFFLFFLLVFFSCDGNEVPEGVMPVSSFKKVVWDVFQAETYLQQFQKKDASFDSLKYTLQFQQEIFAHHKINADTYFKSYEYYKSNPESMKMLMDSVMLYGEKERSSRMQNQFGSRPTQAETN